MHFSIPPVAASSTDASFRYETWAEEIKLGTFEFLICLPVKIIEVVVGKFLAAWIYSG